MYMLTACIHVHRTHTHTHTYTHTKDVHSQSNLSLLFCAPTDVHTAFSSQVVLPPHVELGNQFELVESLLRSYTFRIISSETKI